MAHKATDGSQFGSAYSSERDLRERESQVHVSHILTILTESVERRSGNLLASRYLTYWRSNYTRLVEALNENHLARINGFRLLCEMYCDNPDHLADEPTLVGDEDLISAAEELIAYLTIARASANG